jgi:hypothetical protein
VGKKQTPCAAEYGSRGCCWGLRDLGDLVVLTPPLPAINGSTDTQRGHNRWYVQDNIWQLYSSDKRQLQAPVAVTVLLRQTARRTALPMPTQKAKSLRRAGAGGDGTAWSRLSGERRGDITLQSPSCPHPFRPFCSALRSVVYFEDTHPHPATPADSLAYTTQWADRVTTSPHTNWAVCTTSFRTSACRLSVSPEH